jgi:hypothetical protein
MSPWLHKIFSDLEQAERRIDDSPELDDELPAWAKNAARWLLQTAFPKMALGQLPENLSARKVGMLLGYKWIYAALLREIAARPAAPEVEAVASSLLNAHAHIQEVVRNGVLAAIEAASVESGEFFNGFGSVFVKKTAKKLTKKQKTLHRTQAVYLTLLLNCRDVPTGVTSVKLFDWLDERLPPEIVGVSTDWIRGICGRIEFPLAREGRPSNER